MEDIEKVKVLIDISKLSFARYDQRRKYHWQLSIGFWALIVGATIKRNDFPLPEYYKEAWVLVISALLYIFLWLLPVWIKGEKEKAIGKYYQNKAKSILADEKYDKSTLSGPKFTKWYKFFCDWGNWQQIIVTAILFWFLYRVNFFR